MAKTGRKLAAVFLAVAMVIAFIPLIGTQEAYAAGETDTITKVVLSFQAGYTINGAFKEGDPVEQFAINIKSVESTNGQVSAEDLLFDKTDYYGWCHSYISGGETEWIKYSDDDAQGLSYTDGESRFMADVYEHPFELFLTDSLPVSRDTPKPLGGHLNGCRIGFDER